MLKIKHEPKQLTDVIAIPVLFTVLFTYIFGGAISGSPGHYLTILLPGTLGMGIALHHVRRRPPRPGRDHRGVRPLPLPAHLARRLRVGGLLGDAGRYLFAAAIVVILGI